MRRLSCSLSVIAAFAAAFLLAGAGWLPGDSARLALLRGGTGSGGVTESAGLRLAGGVTAGAATFAPASATATLYPGRFAPSTDAAGLITQARMSGALLGAAPADPLALDFAGNRDGRVDVSDLVTLVNRLVP